MQTIRSYNYDSADVLLPLLEQDLEKIQLILSESGHDKDSIYFDVDLNSHLYVQVQTKPAEFMSMSQLTRELHNVFKEWSWLIRKIKKQNIDIWVFFNVKKLGMGH